MFINQGLVVALEYIFYQKEGEYNRIKKEKKDDHAENYTTHPLGTFKYTNGLKEKFPGSIYQNPPIALVENKTKNGNLINYLEEHTNTHNKKNKNKKGAAPLGMADMLKQQIGGQVDDHHNVDFMKTPCGNALAEAVLSLWEINEKGQIMKKQEISFDYGMNY